MGAVWNWLTRRYVGTGMTLGYYQSEGKALKGVFVLARLLKSPAHEADVRKFDQVLEYAGRTMDFATPTEMVAFIKSVTEKLRPGDKITIKIMRAGVVLTKTLTAAVIRGRIPVHLPQVFPSPNDADHHDYHYGVARCTRTGEWVPTMRLSEQRLNDLFG